jgi:PAS domain-containing protein
MAGKNDSDFVKSAAFQKLRKRAEDDLRKSEQEKTAILDSLMEHVIYHDREMRILWANSAACQ